MGLAVIALAGLTGVAAVLIIGAQNAVYANTSLSSIPSRPVSPLDEAQRILAGRYANGEITPDEYSRMLSILRR